MDWSDTRDNEFARGKEAARCFLQCQKKYETGFVFFRKTERGTSSLR
jgi:hypothetical protein